MVRCIFAVILAALFIFPVCAADVPTLVTRAAEKHGVPPKIAHAVVKAESGYRCDAKNKSGAVGIMQTLPSTARSVGVHGPLTDCHNGLEAGMRYLALIVRQHGVSCESLSLYERGLGAPPRCTPYGRKIMASQ